MAKPDKSPKVPQKDKLKNPLCIRELVWTDKQKEFINLATHKDTKIMMVTGPAGCAKTLLSVYASLKLLNEKRISDIIYVRSAVESSQAGLGFLPGTVDEKMMFYNFPFCDKLNELLEKKDVAALQEQQRVTMFPVNFARGMSWNAKMLIFDEAQNSTFEEIQTILTRMGKFSRCFLLADPRQTDLRKNTGGFQEIFNGFKDEEDKAQGIHAFEFGEEDVMRSDLVKYLVKKFKQIR
jgi:phosphate starvation-inducible PhoH-like protein